MRKTKDKKTLACFLVLFEGDHITFPSVENILVHTKDSM